MTGETFLQIKSSAAERLLAAAGVFVISVGVVFVWFFNPASAGFFPVCPLYKITGIACPGCGLTRGFHALFHGDVWTALDFNALIPVFAFVFGYFSVSLFLVAVRGRGLSWRFFPPAALWGFLIGLALFAILRNLPIYPFSVLAP